MTENKTIIKKKLTAFDIFTSSAVCFLFALFMRNSHIALEYVRDGISVCLNTLIPSLFPYLILSDMAAVLPLTDMVGNILKRPMTSLFGVSGAGACSFILGTLCGFPIGAKSAVKLYDEGKLQRYECEKLIALCSIPSISFTVNVVGLSVFGSTSVGWIFWICAVSSSVISGIFNNFLLRKKHLGNLSKNDIMYSDRYTNAKKSSAGIFVGAIERSAKSTLLICSYVIFFSCLTGSIGLLLSRLEAPSILNNIIGGLLELTCGAKASVSVSNLCLRTVMCGVFIGWSGISVHLQIFSICSGRGLDFSSFIAMKLLQGALCGAMMFSIFNLCPAIFDAEKNASITDFGIPTGQWQASYALVFIIVLTLLFLLGRKGHWQSK